MKNVSAELSAEFEGSAQKVYDVIADYHVGHPSILPERYFTHLDVEQGGRGAGTVIRYGVKLGGRVQLARAEIREPEPGRVLEEHILDERGTVTTFIVEQRADDRVRVTIRTCWRASGLKGAVEKLIAPPLLRRIYREQLAKLQTVMATA